MKSYIVKTGDTLEGIAFKQYGLGSEATRILASNPNIGSGEILKEGTVLNIPDIENSSLKKNPLKVDSKDQNEVALLIEGELFTFWTDANVRRSMDTIGDTFELKAPWTPENLQYREIFRPFRYQDVVIYIGGEKIITGTAVTINTTVSGDRQDLLVSGYSRAAVLNDVMMPPSSYPLEFKNLDLQQITQRLVQPFGLKVTFLSLPGAAFKKVALTPDKNIYSFLIELAQQRGLVISSDVEGDLIFQKSSVLPAVASIIEGQEPFVNSSITFNGQERYSTFTGLGDGWKKGSGETATVEDNTVKEAGALRPLVFKVDDVDSGDLQSAVKAKLGRSIATSIELTVTIKDWRNRLGQLWKDNQRIIFQAPGNMLYSETEYIIRNIEYIKTSVGETANLTLVFPEAYSGEIRTKFPWDQKV